MKSISAIIKTLSEEEKKQFVLQLKRKNRRNDVKNVMLFKHIYAGKTEDLDTIIYGKPSKNAYHALCKRLQDSLIEFVASKSFAGEASEELEILKLLLASRIFFEQKQYKIGFKTLEKAEKEALKLDLYAILNEIYHTKIQYAHFHPSWALSNIIEASLVNMDLFKHESKLNMAYATIKEALKNEKGQAINEILIRVFSDFDIKIDERLTYRSLYQLMNITSIAAELQNDYYSISPFMMEIYTIINQKREIADKHLFYHIEILNLMAISFFRNRNFILSMSFVRKMEEEMQKMNGKYHHRFYEKMILIKALNYNYTGKYKNAINVLQALAKPSLDVRLIIVMFLFQQSRYSDAYQVLKKLNHSDIWYEKKAGWIWVLKKNIIEILLLIELNQLDLVLLRLQSFKRRFQSRLKEAGEERVITFIKFVDMYYENPVSAVSIDFKELVEHSFEWVGVEREDIFVMSFYAWLKSKMEEENLYTTTLNLVRH